MGRFLAYRFCLASSKAEDFFKSICPGYGARGGVQSGLMDWHIKVYWVVGSVSLGVPRPL